MAGKDDLTKYSRQVLFAGIGEAGQRVLGVHEPGMDEHQQRIPDEDGHLGAGCFAESNITKQSLYARIGG